MNNYQLIKGLAFYIFFALLVLISSCTSDNVDDPVQYDCEFIQDDSTMQGLIDSNELETMLECYQNRIMSLITIKENILGEWELLGHGEGWILSNSQPCGYLKITEEELSYQYENAYMDTITFHSWEIIENNGVFSLELEPRAPQDLYINVFCFDFMYGDATPFDGNMYLFQKVE